MKILNFGSLNLDLVYQMGTFQRFKNTDASIYSMQVTDSQYKNIENKIYLMNKCSLPYSFNFIGLCAAGFNVRIKREHSFYCAEFVKYLMDNAKIENDLPDVIKPEHFKYMGLNEIYKGKLRDYSVLETMNIVA